MEQSSPPHQDKAEGVDGATADKCDMERDASFYVFSFHDKSTFEFYLQKGRGVPNPSKKEVLLLDEDIVWKKALASGSLLKVSAKDNREYFHAQHKAKVDHNPNPTRNPNPNPSPTPTPTPNPNPNPNPNPTQGVSERFSLIFRALCSQIVT